jgi:hypothetical protein
LVRVSDVAEWLRDGCPLAPLGPLAPIIARAMAPDREQRFADADAMARALRAIVVPPPRASTELGARVRQCVQAAEAVGDLDRLVIAAFGGEASRRERTATAAATATPQGDVISGELAIDHETVVSTVVTRRRLGWRARRWLPALAVLSAALIAWLAPRQSRRAEANAAPIADGAGAPRNVPEVAPPAADELGVPTVATATTTMKAPVTKLTAKPIAKTVPKSERVAVVEHARHAAPAIGYLTLDTQPWGAVYLDGKRLGVTPFARVAVPAGRHRLSVDVEESGKRRALVVRVAPRAETQLVAPLR